MAVAKRKDPARTEATTAAIAAIGAVPMGFTAEARAAARARLADMELPGRRDEYWRWTDPAPFLDAVAPSEPLRVARPIFEALDKVRLVFTDGVFDAAASDDPALAGVEITLLSRAAQTDIHWAKGLFGALEADGHQPVMRPMAALNTAAATEGVLIRATGRAEKPVHISYRQSAPASEAILHHVIRVEPGADLTVLETGSAAARGNILMEVDVAEGAGFHHIRPQGRALGRTVLAQLFARVGAGASFKSFTLTANGRLTRNESHLRIAGDNAVAHIAGAVMGDGAVGPFHQDDTVFIEHDAVGCESRQMFKKVLRNGAVGVFQGKILVKPGAQKTDGYQISQALLMDDNSQHLAKPELEIYADDVQCSHGSTSGAIDETAMFYLRSRGVPRRQAQDMLVLAFLAETLGEIEDKAIADEILARLEEWLGQGRAEDRG